MRTFYRDGGCGCGCAGHEHGVAARGQAGWGGAGEGDAVQFGDVPGAPNALDGVCAPGGTETNRVIARTTESAVRS